MLRWHVAIVWPGFYIKNANHSIENLTNNGELETYDGQLLLIQHQPRLRTYLNGTLSNLQSNLQHCDCEKETEFEFFSVKQNTVEEFEFKCRVDVGKKST